MQANEASPNPPGDTAESSRNERHEAPGLVSRVEGWIGGALFLAIVVLLTAEIVLRTGGGLGVPGAASLVRHLTLWLAFLGAALAASEGKMLALATGQLMPEGRARRIAQALASIVAVAATALLARAALDFTLVEKEFGDTIAYGIPTWVALLVMPVPRPPPCRGKPRR